MQLDELIPESFISKLEASEGEELLECINFVEMQIADALEPEDDIVQFSDKKFRDRFISILIKLGKKENNTLIRFKLLQIILFSAPSYEALDLVSGWLISVTHKFKAESSLLRSIIDVMERNGIIFDRINPKRGDYSSDEIFLAACDYLKNKELWHEFLIMQKQ